MANKKNIKRKPTAFVKDKQKEKTETPVEESESDDEVCFVILRLAVCGNRNEFCLFFVFL